MRLLLTLLAFVLLASPASAAWIDVTSSTDDGTGCTLREAVAAANTDAAVGECAAGAGADTIDIGGRTIALDDVAAGDIEIDSDVAITGPSPEFAVIDAAALGDRVFDVSLFGALTLNSVAVRNGHAPPSGLGGAIVTNGGTVTVLGSVLEGNRSGGGDPGAGGGAIYAEDATLTIEDSVLRDNSAGDATGSHNGGDGGALLLENTVTQIEQSAFIGNRSGHGGPSGGVAGYGGAIWSQDISNMEQHPVGWPDVPGETEPDAPVTIVSSTFSGNEVGTSGSGATPTRGIGIVSLYDNPGEIDFVTFSGNSQFAPAVHATSAVVVSNSAFDAGEQCLFAADGGGNVTAEPDTDVCGGDEVGSLGLRAQDGVLIPAEVSVLVDRIDAPCPDDQRGYGRPIGPKCDVGAVEFRPGVLTAAPSELLFAGTPVGTTSAPQTVEFTYAGDYPLSDAAFNIAGPFSAVPCGDDELTDGETCAVQVRFTPPGAGLWNGFVSLENARVELDGSGTAAQSGGPTGPGGGSGDPQITRASIAGAKLRRKGKRVRLHVKLACPAGPGCAERLVADFKHKKRRRHLERTVEMPAGKTSSRRLQLPGGYAKKLRKRAKVRVKVTLRYFGHDDITRRFRLTVR